MKKVNPMRKSTRIYKSIKYLENETVSVIKVFTEINNLVEKKEVKPICVKHEMTVWSRKYLFG